jgi:hypothetical protein
MSTGIEMPALVAQIHLNRASLTQKENCYVQDHRCPGYFPVRCFGFRCRRPCRFGFGRRNGFGPSCCSFGIRIGTSEEAQGEEGSRSHASFVGSFGSSFGSSNGQRSASS